MERKYLVGGMATAAIALLTVVTYDTVNPYRDVVQPPVRVFAQASVVQPPTETVSTATPTGQTSTDVAVATGGRKTELKEQDARKGGEQEASARQNRTDLQAQAKQDDKAAALKDIARAEPAKSPKPAPKPSVEFRNAPSDKKTRSVLDQSRTAPGIGGGGILGLVTPQSGTKNNAHRSMNLSAATSSRRSWKTRLSASPTRPCPPSPPTWTQPPIPSCAVC